MSFWEFFVLLLIFVPLIMLWIFTLGDLAGRTDISGLSRGLWAVAVVLLPVIGMLIYFLTRPVDPEMAPEPEVGMKQIMADSSAIYNGRINGILSNIGATRNQNKEQETVTKYISKIVSDDDELSSDETDLINYFITYGTQSTKFLGEGERAGVLGSYKKAFGRLPKTESEWADAVKIGNGRWPSEESVSALNEAKVHFKTVYLRDADMGHTYDNAAVSVIAYGLRSSARNMDSEKAAIKTFRYIYGYDPSSSLDWDIVRAIAYSGATR